MSKPAKDEAALLKRAGEAIRKALIKPPGCTESTGCAVGPCHCAHVAAEAALAAIRAAGWAVVPVEPTEEMLDIGTSHIFQPGVTWQKCASDAYRAMLAAAPGVKP
jgi:hypothetical protein